MSEYLVAMEIRLPDGLDTVRRDMLLAAEARRAAELFDQGVLRRLWRVPGRRANWGLWAAPDATALHDALQSLPLWPWADVHVHALAGHPNDLNEGAER